MWYILFRLTADLENKTELLRQKCEELREIQADFHRQEAENDVLRAQVEQRVKELDISNQSVDDLSKQLEESRRKEAQEADLNRQMEARYTKTVRLEITNGLIKQDFLRKTYFRSNYVGRVKCTFVIIRLYSM